MAQEVQVYDNDVVQNSCYYQKYKSTLAEIAIRDYGKDYGFSFGVEALDIDAVERNSTGQNDKTMDAAIGIANYKNNSSSNQRFLLVELRMNYTRQAHNASITDMKNKDSHTRTLLTGCQVDQQSFFVFTKDVAPCKRSQIKRLAVNDSSLKNWVILSPDDFVNRFQFVQNLPYQPVSPIDNIKVQCQNFIQSGKNNEVIKCINFWIQKVEDFYNQYNLNECKALIELIEYISNEIKKNNSCFSDDEKLEFEITQDDLQRCKKLLSKY